MISRTHASVRALSGLAFLPMYRTYDAITRVLASLADPVLRLPSLRAHRERLGRLPESVRRALGERPVVWVHSASVGEVLASVPLLRGLRARLPGHAVLASTTSLAGRDLAHRLPEVDCAVLLPFDAIPAIDRALSIIRPVVFVFTETEVWPNLLRRLDERNVPAVLLSGRVSPRGFRRYLRIRGLLREASRHVRFFGMQTEADAERIRALGAAAERVAVTGSLKLDVEAPPAGLDVRTSDPLWIAGSTHSGEEEVCISVHGRLRRRFPRLRFMLAPRHLDRIGEVERELERAGLPFVRRSRLDGVWSGTPEVLLLDTLGELAALYSRATVAFVGGTLSPVGGHNLLEPARAGVPVLFGPHLDNVVEMARALERSGGGRRVAVGESLEEEISNLLDDEAARVAMGRAAGATFPRGEVTERSLAAIARFLPGGEP